MRFVDEYRDPAAARVLLEHITALAEGRQLKFMEVCGGHTHAIYRHGIEQMLPESVELVRKARKASAAGFVNAVLRRAPRGDVEWPARDVALSMPEWLLDRWGSEFGSGTAERIAAEDEVRKSCLVLMMEDLPLFCA